MNPPPVRIGEAAVVARERVSAGLAEASLLRRATALLLLNLLDGLFTVGFLQVNVAEEANPLMRLAYDTSPLAFMAAKLLAVQGGVLVLWSQRQVPLAQSALRGAAWLYGGLVAWHLAFLARLLVG